MKIINILLLIFITFISVGCVHDGYARDYHDSKKEKPCSAEDPDGTCIVW